MNIKSRARHIHRSRLVELISNEVYIDMIYEYSRIRRQFVCMGESRSLHVSIET